MFTLIQGDNHHTSEPEKRAVRAVIVQGSSIILMHVSSSNTYVLPGGGVHEGETLEAALKREVLEETGFEINHYEYVTTIDEYHDTMTRRHHIYRVTIGNTKNPISMTQEEHDLSMRMVCLPLEEAIHRMAFSKGTHPYSEAIQLRDFIALMHTL